MGLREVVNVLCGCWCGWVEVVVECSCWKRLLEVVIGKVKGSCEW